MGKVSDLKIKNLSFYYSEAEHAALSQISLEIPAGQFVVLAGASGSGKSTLLRVIAGLAPGFYAGSRQGEVLVNGKESSQFERRMMIKKVGLVFQDPESQLIMMTVEQEITFGMENMGVSAQVMKRRVMEVSSALGLSRDLNRFIPELSGGQKQKVALASILAMQPEILLLDEPTSQLDPIAAEEFLTIIRRLNEENGITVILAEQRLEKACHLSDRILFMEDGRMLLDYDLPSSTDKYWPAQAPTRFLPPIPRLFAETGFDRLPMTVKEGRHVLKTYFQIPDGLAAIDRNDGETAVSRTAGQCLIDVQKVWFSYPDGTEVLKNVNLKIETGDFIAIMGENGAGKTTLLKHLNGLHKPGRGKVKVFGEETMKLMVEDLAPQIAYLSQNPNDYLFLPTVGEELSFSMDNLGLKDEGIKAGLANRLNIADFVNRNPRDLSTGERQRVALAAVMVSRPRVLLLDEPTRGLDYRMKETLGQMLRQLCAEGVAIVMVTHDVEFVAEYAELVALLYAGSIISRGSTREVLPDSTFYASQMSKLFRHIIDDIVTVDEGKAALCKLLKNNGIIEGGR